MSTKEAQGADAVVDEAMEESWKLVTTLVAAAMDASWQKVTQAKLDKILAAEEALHAHLRALSRPAGRGWVSVDEALPEEGATVLAALHSWDDPTKPLIACHARYEFGLWIDLSPEEGSVGDVELHTPKLWLQVPELPAAHGIRGGGGALEIGDSVSPVARGE